MLYLTDAATVTGSTSCMSMAALISAAVKLKGAFDDDDHNATTAEDRLAELGIHLPDAPTPFGAYVPAVQTGNLLFLSGMLATSGHTATAVGIVGKDLDVKAGREAAYTAALNVLALRRNSWVRSTA